MGSPCGGKDAALSVQSGVDCATRARDGPGRLAHRQHGRGPSHGPLNPDSLQLCCGENGSRRPTHACSPKNASRKRRMNCPSKETFQGRCSLPSERRGWRPTSPQTVCHLAQHMGTPARGVRWPRPASPLAAGSANSPCEAWCPRAAASLPHRQPYSHSHCPHRCLPPPDASPAVTLLLASCPLRCLSPVLPVPLGGRDV